jgi:hypothetical protein
MEGQGTELVTPEIDKRQHRRAKLVTEVKCEAMNRDEVFVTRDVSVGGLFLTAKKPFPLNSEVILSFSLGPGLASISCGGKVVYSMQGLGMGIEFSRLSDETRSSLEKFVDEGV